MWLIYSSCCVTDLVSILFATCKIYTILTEQIECFDVCFVSGFSIFLNWKLLEVKIYLLGFIKCANFNMENRKNEFFSKMNENVSLFIRSLSLNSKTIFDLHSTCLALLNAFSI